MMKVRYRLIEKFYPDEGWAVWGAIYENRSGRFADSPTLIISIPDDDRRTGRHLERRIVEFNIGVENADRLVDPDYPICFRVLPEIYTVEGESHREIWQKLWDRIYAAMGTRAEAEKPIPLEYTVPRAYQVLRESDEAEESTQ